MAKPPTFDQRLGNVAYRLDNIANDANGARGVLHQGTPPEWAEQLSEDELTLVEASIVTVASAMLEVTEVVARVRQRMAVKRMRQDLAMAEERLQRLEGGVP